jgi:hypothetical protein
MQIDYLRSDNNQVHAINCHVRGNEISIGVLCLMAFQESTCRISSDNHSFVVAIPLPLRSGSERVKAFNTTLSITSHEQI